MVSSEFSYLPKTWLAEWGVQRCGQDLPQVHQAMDLLMTTIYRPSQNYLFCCGQPIYCGTVVPHDSHTHTNLYRPSYNNTMLGQAWSLLIDAAPICNNTSFDYDVVDIGREYLSTSACLTAYDNINATQSSENLTKTTQAYLDVTNDIDAVLATSEGFLLGSWFQGARDLDSFSNGSNGSNETLSDFYEWNARSQITTWYPIEKMHRNKYTKLTGLNDYARKQWSGMISQFYNGRVHVWLNYTLRKDQKQNGMYNTTMDEEDELNQLMAKFAYTFERTTLKESNLPIYPVGKTIDVATALLEKYQHW
jgi:alpha-N-acetylglucosaminidase